MVGFGLKKKLKKEMETELAALTKEELQSRLVAADAANAMLSNKLSMCEARLNVLQAFKTKHEAVWGALTAEEVALFAKCEQTLMEQNPGGLLSKYHDAVFVRSSLEAAQAECRKQTDALLLRAQLAEEEAARIKAELAAAHGLLAEQKRQATLYRGRMHLAEDAAAVAQAKWKEYDKRWCQASLENDALLERVRALAEENAAVQAQCAALAAEVAALHSDGGWERLAADNEAKMQAVEAALMARFQAEAECFAASMCDELKVPCDEK
jgi:hypothetical protein